MRGEYMTTFTMREVSDWEKNAVTEIILTLELGGTKADLERMLKELD